MLYFRGHDNSLVDENRQRIRHAFQQQQTAMFVIRVAERVACRTRPCRQNVRTLQAHPGNSTDAHVSQYGGFAVSIADVWRANLARLAACELTQVHAFALHSPQNFRISRSSSASVMEGNSSSITP